MYTNRISRTTTKRQPQFFIRRSDIAFDVDKRLYVESVCAVLIESRFGPGCVDPVIINLSDEAETEPSVFYDLNDQHMTPCHALSPLGRNGYQTVEAAYRRAKQRGVVAAASDGSGLTSGYSPNLGRGSP